MVSLHNLHDREFYFGEYARWRLEVSAGVVCCQFFQAFFVISDMTGLKNLRSCSKCHHRISKRIITLLIVIIESQTNIIDVCHHAKTVFNFEIETRTDFMDKSIGILVILWMVIIGLEQI